MEKKSVQSRIGGFFSRQVKDYATTVKRSYKGPSATSSIFNSILDREQVRNTLELAKDTELTKPKYSFEVAMAKEGLDEHDLEKGHNRLMLFNKILFVFSSGLTACNLFYLGVYIRDGIYPFAIFSLLTLALSMIIIGVLYLKHSWMAYRIRNRSLLTIYEWFIIIKSSPSELMPFIDYHDKHEDLFRR